MIFFSAIVERVAGLGLAAVLLAAPVSAEPNEDWQWLLSFRDKDTSQLIVDPSFGPFLYRVLPRFKAEFGFKRRHGKSTLPEAVKTVLGGPAQPIRFPSEKTLVMDSCRMYSCDEKGFAWLDLGEKNGVFAIIHHVYEGTNWSKRPQLFLIPVAGPCSDLPKGALVELRTWLGKHKLKPQPARCIEAGLVSELPTI
jgi:hypothetical protein